MPLGCSGSARCRWSFGQPPARELCSANHAAFQADERPPRAIQRDLDVPEGAAPTPGSAHDPTATMSASYFDWLRVRSKIASTLSFMLTSQVLSRGTPKSWGLTHPSPRTQRAPPGLRRTRPANVAGRSTPLMDSIPWMVRNTSLFSAREGNEPVSYT